MKTFKTVVDKESNHNGFQLTFFNGNTISVMFGKHTYSDNGETTAEIAAWNEKGEWMLFQDEKWLVIKEGSEVMSHQTSDQLAKMMFKLSNL